MNTQRFTRVLAILTASTLILSSSCTKSAPAESTPVETTAAITSAIETTVAPTATPSPTSTPTPVPTETVPLPTETTMPDLGPLNIANVEGVNDPIDPVAQKDPNIENILLLGIDGGDGVDIGHRSDCMCVLSINTKDNTIKLSSLMRDIKAYFPATGKWGKLNAAYQYGGPGQAVNVINYNFGLDIQKYLVLDFESFRATVDAIGGVDIEMTAKEAQTIYGSPEAQAGVIHVDGFVSLLFCRVRKLDSDFNRVARQRRFLIAVFKKLRTQDLVTQYTACHNMLSIIRTNMGADELTGQIYNFTLNADQNVTEYTVPAADMYTSTSSGTYYIKLNWDAQIPALQAFIYGA
ncbi:MAG: LCP family protein [Eubacteriales bacterium]